MAEKFDEWQERYIKYLGKFSKFQGFIVCSTIMSSWLLRHLSILDDPMIRGGLYAILCLISFTAILWGGLTNKNKEIAYVFKWTLLNLSMLMLAIYIGTWAYL